VYVLETLGTLGLPNYIPGTSKANGSLKILL